MRMNGRTVGLVAAVAIGLFVGGVALAASDPRMAEAQRFYDDAMYTRALEVLDQLAASNPSGNVHQYRALCYIALGRSEAAERAMAEIVAAEPQFALDPDVASPRVIAQFAAVRRRLLPPLIRRGFAEATALFREGAPARAQERFNDVLRLLDDPALQNDQGLADLGLVASAFVELTRAQTAPPPPVVATVRPVVPVAAPVSPSPVPAGAEPAPPAASLAVPSQSPGPMRVTASEPAAFEPAVAMVRPLPKWTPPDPRTAARTFAGSIALNVDERGRVTGAETVRMIHPAYDPVVLAAARQWVFQPARQRGKPVRSEVTVEIELLPSTNTP